MFKENIMITRCIKNPLHWNADSLISPVMLPYYVERVAKEGGDSLIVNGNTINVKEAVRLKTIADGFVLESFLAISDTSNGNAITKMRQYAFKAGKYYRLYVRILHLTENLFGTPTLLNTHQELCEHFKQGYFYDPLAERNHK